MKKLVLAALALSSAAQAEVKSSTAGGFELENKFVLAATPAETYAAIGRIGQWWSSGHTYSGKAENLSLELKAGGCFCERLADGGTVEHMRVVFAQPGKTLRLQGALGPLQAGALAGTMTWALKPVQGGTEVTHSYVVGGYVAGGADKYAGPVDQVLGEQLKRFQTRLGR
jgi:uncharacterized protein YndB with AHSA1/START domain